VLRGKKSAVLTLDTLELSTTTFFFAGLVDLSLTVPDEALATGLEVCKKPSGVGPLVSNGS
jgi:hypothetical protein